jgi:hypothetical protein
MATYESLLGKNAELELHLELAEKFSDRGHDASEKSGSHEAMVIH